MPEPSPQESSLEKENLALKQKIDELERTLIETEDKSRAPQKEISASWQEQALFAFLLLISAIPSYMVVKDRWFEKLTSIKAVDEFWWNTPALKTLGYPRYFLIVFMIVILTAAIVFLWRKGPLLVFSNLSLVKTEPPERQVERKQNRTGFYLLVGAFIITDISALYAVFTGRIPGWELLLILALFIVGRVLMEFPIADIKSYFQSRWRFLLDAALFVVALCCALYAVFGESKPNYIFFAFLLLAIINFLKHRKETPAIFWIGAAALVALTWKIDGWEYVVIGDEYSFYTEVGNILEQRTAWDLINTTFNGNFVYGTHPYFSSYIHDFFMKLFDNHNFGWRFSNPFLVASSLFFFYYFFRAHIPRRAALLTVILLGFSHYLLSFSKIGYNNLQALFALSLMLAAFTWALRSMSLTSLSLLGLSIGFCFYVYPAALYLTPLPFLGLLIFLPPTNKAALKRWGWIVLSAALLIYPLAVQPKYWEAKIPGTFFYTDVSNSAEALSHNVSVNLLYSFLSFLYAPEQSHYVSTGYMDPISAVFIVIGLTYLIKLGLGRNKSALFLALSFLLIFVAVGATHGRNFPTATRMFLFLPWFALSAALGLEWCAEKAEDLFNANRRSLINLTVGLIVIVNLYQAYVVDIRNMAQYHTLAPMFVKVAREIKANLQSPPKSYAFVAPPGWNTSGMEIVQRVYQVPDSPRQLITLPVEGTQLPASAVDLATQRDVVVIVKADIDGVTMSQVGAQLQGWGKSLCEIRNGKGALQFQLWHSGDLGWLCQ